MFIVMGLKHINDCAKTTQNLSRTQPLRATDYHLAATLVHYVLNVAGGRDQHHGYVRQLRIPLHRFQHLEAIHTPVLDDDESEEDHKAALGCNIVFLMHYQEMLNLGWLPRSLDDMPHYDNVEIIK